jgi:NAD(P)-dependent dehydrogenase (short-subunit alcohol dehydrogenase family)
VTGRYGGRVAIVTGGGNGLGRASARRLAAEGASVVVVDIDGVAADAVASALPTRSIGVRADVADEAEVHGYLTAAVDHFGRVDMHHLNAGIFGGFEPLPESSVEVFDRVMAVNTRGVFLGLRAAFRQFRDQATGGAIVVTGSIAGLTGSADLLPYHVSKHAVHGLVQGAAVYGGPLGIRVNAVAPGIVPTDLFAAAARHAGGRDDMARRASTTPLRRAGRAEEIAAVVSFLLSEDASYMTGQIVSADGGATAVNPVRPSGGAGAWDPRPVDAATYGTQWSGGAQS